MTDEHEEHPTRSFAEILQELVDGHGGNTEGAGAIYLDDDGIHGRLPENVRKMLLSALERNKTGEGRKSLIRREALRASRDVVRMLKAQLISRCEMLERAAEWTETEAVEFVEIATAACSARLMEEVVHYAAIEGYTAEEGKALIEMSADEYVGLVERAEERGASRVMSVLSSGRRRHERLERYKGIMAAFSDLE